VSDVEQAWSVSQLARTLKRRVEEDFSPVWVRGELVGVKRYPSGHIYFSLRDELAKVDCTIWRSVASRIKTPIEEGTEVFALGQPNVWEERTSLRFNVVQLLPAAAIGAAAQLFEKTKQALLADGLLDPARKRQIPPFAARIAVVTSVAGAAVRDIITVARRRWPGVELLVVNSAVQGEGAPAELVRALGIVARLEHVDCCIVGRGGGGKEDLAAFNNEGVCRAIAACPVPVISAVGHEVDITLADLVADVRAATPSQAAEFALPDHRDVAFQVDGLRDDLGQAITALITRRAERLERTRDRLGAALIERLRVAERRLLAARGRLGPALVDGVRQSRERLVAMRGTLRLGVERQLNRRRTQLGELGAKLDALSPLAVLQRGFSVARDKEGRVLKRRQDFKAGQAFTLRVTDGTIPARMEE
jgi:exodeoxyribonuclease VII large subunit